MEDEQTGHSRLFVILAIALIGLLVLGLLGIGGVFVIRQNLQEQAALAEITPTLMIKLPDPSPTPTPVKVAATSVPVGPTPTSTPVLAAGSSGGGEQASVGNGNNTSSENQPKINLLPTPVSAPAGGASEAGLPEQVPETGLGALESILLAAGLIIVLFIARRMRMASQ